MHEQVRKILEERLKYLDSEIKYETFLIQNAQESLDSARRRMTGYCETRDAVKQCLEEDLRGG